MAKVSVVVPIYNVEKYLRQCLDSIANQTLADIEVICVNDGSSDSSLDIIMEYVGRDQRFKVIDKLNSGYGNSMNMGFDLASGEYIAIVESDDYADLSMLERLYACAKENDLDVCKGGFYYYYSVPKEKNIPCVLGSAKTHKNVFCPTKDFKNILEQIEFFSIKPTIWSAIYKNEFIKENKIRFSETPGASFQDASFNFKVWAVAKRALLLKDCFLHYRQDNENSSVKSDSKVFCVCDEYLEMEAFLKERNLLKTDLVQVKNALKLDTYIWNYERLCEEKAREFILAVSPELSAHVKDGTLSRHILPRHKWNKLCLITENPEEFHRVRQEEKKKEKPILESEIQGSFLKRAFLKIKRHGIKSIFRRLVGKR